MRTQQAFPKMRATRPPACKKSAPLAGNALLVMVKLCGRCRFQLPALSDEIPYDLLDFVQQAGCFRRCGRIFGCPLSPRGRGRLRPFVPVGAVGSCLLGWRRCLFIFLVGQQCVSKSAVLIRRGIKKILPAARRRFRRQGAGPAQCALAGWRFLHLSRLCLSLRSSRQRLRAY